MYEHAIVTSIGENHQISVTCQTESCANCKGGMFCSVKGKTFIATNSNDLPLNTGDEVELYLPPGKTVFSGFITLLFPLLLFPLGYYLPSLLSSDPTELIKAMCGLIGIVLGFVIGRIFSQVKGKEYMPTITRTIEKEEE